MSFSFNMRFDKRFIIMNQRLCCRAEHDGRGRKSDFFEAALPVVVITVTVVR